jgi:hypothetical protein
VAAVGYDTVGGTPSAPWKIFRISSVVRLVLSLGLGKLVRRDLDAYMLRNDSTVLSTL